MISTELFEACQKWALEGNRTVNIKVDNMLLHNKPKFTIWAYSYELQEGVYIKKQSDLPTNKQLRAIKQESLERKLSQLNQEVEND